MLVPVDFVESLNFIYLIMMQASSDWGMQYKGFNRYFHQMVKIHKQWWISGDDDVLCTKSFAVPGNSEVIVDLKLLG